MKPLISKKLAAFTAMVLVALCLTGCKPDYANNNSNLRFETTISSDGKLVAVLDRIGAETPRIRTKRLDRDEPWQQYPAPKYANSIRFGLTGYGLLITHAQPGPQGASQLSRWDASQPAKPSEILFEGVYVSSPIEVRPGQVLVNLCSEPSGDTNCQKWTRLIWALIENGKIHPIHETRFKAISRYGQPNVTQDGFFWLINNQEFEGNKWVTHLRLFAYALPDGKAPQLDFSRFGDEPHDLICDSHINRCADIYLTDERIDRMTYVYGIKVFEGSNACVVDGIKGYADPITLTPDGKAAVFSIARTADDPRHVVVLRFKSGQCQPTSIQTLHIEEQ